MSLLYRPVQNKHFKCKKVSGCLQVIQKAMIAVDEEGTEAATANAIHRMNRMLVSKLEEANFGMH